MSPKGVYVRGATPEERFWVSVDRSAGPDGCWPWTAATNRRVMDKPYGTKGNRIAVIQFDDVVVHIGVGNDRQIVAAADQLVRAVHQLREAAVARLVDAGRDEDAAHDAADPGLRGGYAASYDSLPDVPLADEGDHYAGMPA